MTGAGVKITVQDKDRGYRRRMAKLRKFFGSSGITVGIHGEDGGAGHEESDLTVGDVASIHEFGLNGVQRSFIGAWFDAEKSNHEDAMVKMAESVVRGDNTKEAALEKLGVFLAADAQKYIQEGRVSPPTVKKDPDDNPTTLIASGQLVGSIRHKVEP